MSTASPRVGLTVMADSDFVNPGVIDGNATKLDQITSVTQCTSTTRPAAPFEGQHIYETDTQNFRRYDATSKLWYLLGSGPNGNGAQGLIAGFQNTAGSVLNGTGIGTAGTQEISLLDYNFAVKANRVYKIIEQGWIMVGGGYTSTLANYWVELYSLSNLGVQPPLSSVNALHYIKKYYSSLKFTARVPFYKSMIYSSGAAGTLYMRSVLRSAVFGGQGIGTVADSVGTYAWIYDMGPSGSSY